MDVCFGCWSLWMNSEFKARDGSRCRRCAHWWGRVPDCAYRYATEYCEVNAAYEYGYSYGTGSLKMRR